VFNIAVCLFDRLVNKRLYNYNCAVKSRPTAYLVNAAIQ